MNIGVCERESEVERNGNKKKITFENSTLIIQQQEQKKI